MVVEPEPAEYVRICDAYGAGFFYIPGTETCMKFSGYVRTHYAGASAEREFSPAGSITGLIGFTPTGADSGPDFQSFLGENESANTWNTRARFDIDTRSETEFGTLRALIRLQSSSASDDGSNSDFEVDKAVISLGGLRAGISDSLFNANFAVVNVAGLASVNTLFGAIGDDASYGFSNAHIADYTINIGDFSISGGVEDSNGANATNASFLAKVEYAADTLIVGAVGERESDEDIAYKIYGNYDLSEFIPGGIIGGWYMGEEIESGSTDNNSTARLGVYDSIWGIGFQMDVTDNVEFFALHSQLNDGTGDVRYSTSDAGGAAITTDAGYAGDTQTTTVGVNWYPADGLKVFGSYTIASSEANFTDIVPATAVDHTVESDSDLFVIGLRRSF